MRENQKKFFSSDRKMKRKQSRKMTKHHLIPKERVKLGDVPEEELDHNFSRVLMLWRSSHDYWHFLFHNLTLGEIIKVLQRIEKIKYP